MNYTIRKRTAIIMCVFAMIISVLISQVSAAYVDVKGSEWYQGGVNFVTASGYMTGTSKDQFDPNGFVTRGMLVTVLYRVSGSKVTGANPFYDVQPNMYFRNAVTWAYKNGIATGVTASYFRPNDVVSREQVVTMLYRYASSLKAVQSAPNVLYKYTDNASVSGYALTAMNWAIQNGIIQGSDGNSLNPTGSLTRAQLAVILERFCNKVKVPTQRTTVVSASAVSAKVTPAVSLSSVVPKFQFPMQYYHSVSSPFGYRNCPYHGYELHSGTDFPAPAGTPILASASGKVIYASECGSYGKLVKIDHGNGYVSYYAHNSAIKVTVGQMVTVGDTIALCGMTGTATGNHSHFEIRYNGKAFDPMIVLPKSGTATAMATVEDVMENSMEQEAVVACAIDAEDIQFNVSGVTAIAESLDSVDIQG